MTRTAQNAAYEHLAAIRLHLARLTVAAEEGFGMGYDHRGLNWGDVGTLENYSHQLRQLTDQVFHEGECAPELSRPSETA